VAAAPVASLPPRRSATGPASPSAAPGPAGHAPPPAAPPASPVRQTGQQVADGVGTVPVVGPAGRDAVSKVVDVVAPPPTVRRALPIRLPAAQ
jgi:hypothetical protein